MSDLPVHIIDNGDSVQLSIGGRRLSMHRGDLLSVTADALVCPIGPELDFQNGLAGIVCRAAGAQMKKARPDFPEPHGKVVVMPGGKLNVKYVFMTVVLGEKNRDKMRSSIQHAVDRAIRYGEFLRLKSIAFPVLGSPQAAPSYRLVAHVMLEEVNRYFRRRNTKLSTILFSAYNAGAFNALKSEAHGLAET